MKIHYLIRNWYCRESAGKCNDHFVSICKFQVCLCWKSEMALPSYIKRIWTLKVIRWVRLCLTDLTSHPQSQCSIGLVFNVRLGICCTIIIFPSVSVQNINNILFCMIIQHRAWTNFCISNYRFRSCLPVAWLDYNQYCYLYLINTPDAIWLWNKYQQCSE